MSMWQQFVWSFFFLTCIRKKLQEFSESNLPFISELAAILPPVEAALC